MWHQLQLISDLESEPQDTVDWARKWLVDFNAGKNQVNSFNQLNNCGVIDVKITVKPV